MDKLDVRRACGEWWRTLNSLDDFFAPSGPQWHPHDAEFDQLTHDLQGWAAGHGLGDGVELADASSAAYRRQASNSVMNKARALIDAIREESQDRGESFGRA
jgi:hypothetical protein